MGKRGFVYIMDNPWMENLYKIGCTERSPHERAAELSNGTGVPDGFRVLCYVEAEDFQMVESQIHRWLSSSRVNPAREFFHGCLRDAVAYLWWHPARLAFCDATAGTTGRSILHNIILLEELEDLPDPWQRNPFDPEEEAKPANAPVLLALIDSGSAEDGAN